MIFMPNFDVWHKTGHRSIKSPAQGKSKTPHSDLQQKSGGDRSPPPVLSVVASGQKLTTFPIRKPCDLKLLLAPEPAAVPTAPVIRLLALCVTSSHRYSPNI